ncbi:MAG: hypothetical protein ACLGHQ_04575 [Acidimicrobiia bacterium]
MNQIETLRRPLRDRPGPDRGGDHPDAPEVGSRPTPDRPPRAASRVLVAALAVIAVLGIIGTGVGFASGDDRDDPSAELEELQAELDAARAERDQALDDAVELDGRIAILRARVTAVEAERDQVTDELTDAGEDVAELEDRLAQLDAAIAALEADLVGAESDRAEALADAAALEAELATARTRAAQAIAERDALAGRFPLTVTPTISIGDATGTYRSTWQERFCSGLATCATAPTTGPVVVRATAEGYLRLDLGGVVSTNLTRVPGGLHAVAGSTTALPRCDGTPRASTVTVTLHPDSWAVARDGAVEIRSWGGAVTIDAPATGSCPAVFVTYGVGLVPPS